MTVETTSCAPRWRVGGISFLLALAAAGCSEHHFEPPDREAQVVAAGSEFSMAAFDSVTWESPEEQGLEGNVVYSTYCRNCHGPLGVGDTEYARTRNLEVPSVVTADWPLAQARDSILHRIFVGHAEGMPTWGVAGISPREMDAVTYYITDVLRPEVLGG
jgi:mono/diheme cytochrome c family protein